MNDAKKSLRKRAEEKLADVKYPLEDMETREIAELIEELRIHQVELELQNEELRRSQEETENARRLYQELWDLSPVGYVIITNSDGSQPPTAVPKNFSAGIETPYRRAVSWISFCPKTRWLFIFCWKG